MPPSFSIAHRAAGNRFRRLAKPKLRRASRAIEIRLSQQPLTQRQTMSAGVDGLLAMDQAGKVELELVLVARRVRTLHLAELTLEARGDDAIDVAAVDRA